MSTWWLLFEVFAPGITTISTRSAQEKTNAVDAMGLAVEVVEPKLRMPLHFVAQSGFPSADGRANNYVVGIGFADIRRAVETSPKGHAGRVACKLVVGHGRAKRVQVKFNLEVSPTL